MVRLPNLDDAYALSSIEDLKSLYAEWAQSYDVGFSDALGYQLPRMVAQAFVAVGGEGPVLDFGAGTGLVMDHLTRIFTGAVDALDLSDEMLAIARDKGRYRDVIHGDIFNQTGLDLGQYGGVVSAGTFTHGHVGPAGLLPLLKLVKPGGKLVISVNAAHFMALDFTAELTVLEPEIAGWHKETVRIYDDRADDEHSEDRAEILILKRR